MAAVALNLGDDWWRLLNLPRDESVIAAAVVNVAREQHVRDLEAIADRTAKQTANYLAPIIGKLISNLAKAMRS